MHADIFCAFLGLMVYKSVYVGPDIICLFILIFPKSTKTKYVNHNHIQRTGQWDHNGTEHCPKYISNGIKTTKPQSPQTTWKVNNI